MFVFKRKTSFAILIPLVTLFVFAFAIFIISTFKDVEIDKMFDPMMDNKGLKIMIAWTDVSGEKLLFISFFVAAAILIEAFFQFKHKSKKDNWFRRNDWLVLTYYIVVIAVILFLNIVELAKMSEMDNGAGVGYDVKLQGTYHLRFYMNLFVDLICWAIYGFIFYFLRFRMKDKQILITGSYWVDAVKIFIFISLTYATVGFLKVVMGRPYPFNVSMKPGSDFYIEMNAKFPDLDTNIKWRYMEYTPWYIPYDFVERMKSIFTKFNVTEYNNAFPSGHVSSTFIVIAMMYLFVGRGRKLSLIKVAGILIWSVQLISLTINMVGFKFHWMSDMMFSIMYCIIYLWLSNYIVEKHMPWTIAKYNGNDVKRQIKIKK